MGGLRAGWGRLWWCRGGVSGVGCSIGRVRVGVATSRWRRRGQWTCSRVRAVVATSSGSGCGGCGLGELVASGGRCGELRWWGL